MRVIVTLVRKDIANFLRNRTAVSLTFIVPIALIYIFGWVFGLNEKDNGPTGIRLAVVNASDNPAAQKLVDALKAEKAFRVVTTIDNPDKTTRPMTEEDVRAAVHDGRFRFGVVIPADVVRADGIGLHLKILSDPRNEIEAQMVNGLLQKTIFSNVPELLGQSLQNSAKKFLGDARLSQFNNTLATTIADSFGGDATTIQKQIESGGFGLDRLTQSATPAVSANGTAAARTPAASNRAQDFFSQLVKIDNEQVVGKDVKSPAATRLVGGWAIMFLLFAVSGSSAAFFDEENAGLFQRLLSAPVTRAQLIWSRFAYGILLGLVQLTTLFIAGRLLYGIDVFGHFPDLVIVCIFAAAACTSFGMLVAAVSPNAQAANGLSTFVVMVMSATG
ncbi:MAG: family transporter protein, partial [Verrucomicrobia bacterium]|nr:family transporter protein [Verrucomicrobiota bacterium]